jgi:D-proline reductase (dithiol) PrdB
MVETKELSLALRAFLKAYRWRVIDPVPCASVSKPLDQCRVALLSSAGFVVPGDEPFSSSIKGGDWTYRVIPDSVDVQSLEDHHRSDSYSHDGVDADRNLGLPLDRLHELVSDGAIGAAAPRHISVMGSITAPGRFTRKTLPEVADIFVEDQVDVALMVPV